LQWLGTEEKKIELLSALFIKKKYEKNKNEREEEAGKNVKTTSQLQNIKKYLFRNNYFPSQQFV
jgi:hypothetical protein